MKVLLDECLPKRLKRELPMHEVTRVQEMGWAGIKKWRAGSFDTGYRFRSFYND